MVVGGVESLGCPVSEPWSAVEVGSGQGPGQTAGSIAPQSWCVWNAHALNKDLAVLIQRTQGKARCRDDDGEERFLSTFSPRILCTCTFLMLSSRSNTIPKYTPDLLLPQSSFIWMIRTSLSVYPIKEIKIYFPFSWSLMRLNLFLCLSTICMFS